MGKVVNDYRIVVSGDEFNAPEVRRFHLQGEAAWVPAGHPNKMTSSPIVAVEGQVVTTRSGSTYILGTRAQGFDAFNEVRSKYPAIPLD
jgi:hypothetical protein